MTHKLLPQMENIVLSNFFLYFCFPVVPSGFGNGRPKGFVMSFDLVLLELMYFGLFVYLYISEISKLYIACQVSNFSFFIFVLTFGEMQKLTFLDKVCVH